MPDPLLRFVAGSGDVGRVCPGEVIARVDDMAESGVFVEGTTRSGKTNTVRLFCEETYGQVQQIIIDPEGQYPSLRSAARDYLVIGKGRDIEVPMRLKRREVEDDESEWEVDPAAARQLVLSIVDRRVSVIFDISEYDLESVDDRYPSDQQLLVKAVCDALVSLPETHPGTIACVIEELQDYAPQGGGRKTAHHSVRRLAKKGLKRGVFVVGVSQRVSDVSKGVSTQLKTKIIGGTDFKDAKGALDQLGLPNEAQLVTNLEKGQFWVKGPAFERHAQIVRVPLAESVPAKRVRGEPPAPAPEASAEIAELAAALREQAETAAKEAAEAEEKEAAAASTKKRASTESIDIDDVAALFVDALQSDDDALRLALDAAIERRIQPMVRGALHDAVCSIRVALENAQLALAS